jgi:hypothetical protein
MLILVFLKIRIIWQPFTRVVVPISSVLSKRRLGGLPKNGGKRNSLPLRKV